MGKNPHDDSVRSLMFIKLVLSQKFTFIQLCHYCIHTVLLFHICSLSFTMTMSQKCQTILYSILNEPLRIVMIKLDQIELKKLVQGSITQGDSMLNICAMGQFQVHQNYYLYFDSFFHNAFLVCTKLAIFVHQGPQLQLGCIIS